MVWPTTSGASGAASAISVAPRGRRRGLRAALATLALIVAAPAGALAADMPEFLRGSYSPAFTRWDGFYFGVQAGETFGSVDFGNSTRSMLNFILANTELQDKVSGWTTLPKGSTTSAAFGGFVGYNFQWDDVVLGGELNYNHMSINIGAQGSIGPIIVPGANQSDGSAVRYNVIVSSTASAAVHDIVTARTRGGWVYENFMPYGFVGLAVGRVDTSRFVTLAGSTKTVTTPTVPPAPPIVVTGPLLLPRDPQSQAQAGFAAYGFTAGLGVEVALLQNVFVRAEWEFIEFPNVNDFRISANSARIAAGLKF
ncbi:MAG TPA: hypothetical protein VGF53_12655 [Pseudolabrys sp.]|jgi:opacity protein-like surface antigen